VAAQATQADHDHAALQELSLPVQAERADVAIVARGHHPLLEGEAFHLPQRQVRFRGDLRDLTTAQAFLGADYLSERDE